MGMGNRYVRTFHCVDCGTLTTRKWQARQPLICMDCAHARVDVVLTAAIEAFEGYKRACRLELAPQRLSEGSGGPLLKPILEPPDHELLGEVAERQRR